MIFSHYDKRVSEDSGGSSYSDDYSLDYEIKIGKWIDGKNIYRKCIESTMPTATDTRKNVNMGMNIDSLVKLTVLLDGPDKIWFAEMPLFANDYPSDFARAFIENDHVVLRNKSHTYDNLRVIIVIEYTKTQDVE